MSRQAMTYTVPQPLEPLNIEELKFWLQIMQEHALFIKAGLPCEDAALIDEAQTFYQELGVLLQRVEKAKTIKQCAELINEVHSTVKEFYCYKRELLQAKLAARLGGTNFPLFLDHISREAEYFLRLLEKMRNGRVVLKECSQTQESVFWLRIMSDHAKLISHLLDPSERSLIKVANEFAAQFDQLVLQGRDFASMLHVHEGEVRAFRRFILDVRTDVQQLRDFKKAAHDLIVECRLIGVLPEKLADHLRREADHFLMLLAMMDRGIMKHSDAGFLEDIPCIDDEYASEEKDGTKFMPVEAPEDAQRPPAATEKKSYKPPKFGVAAVNGDSIAESLAQTGTPDEPPAQSEQADSSPSAGQSKAAQPEKKSAEKARPNDQKEEPSASTSAENGKIMGKASTYKKAMKQEEAKAEAAGEAEVPKTKYKWGGSFPRSLGKIRHS